MLKEWPLVAFTVAGQMAVGVFLLAGVPLLLFVDVPSGVASRPDPAVLAFVFALLAVAVLVSLFHLQHPFRARYALSNIRTSWLSREIFFELGFMALVGLGFLLARRGPADRGILKGVIIGAGLAAVLFLLSMTKLYMLPTVPAWNRASTPLAFLLTALVLGAIVTALVSSARGGPPSVSGVFTVLSAALVAADIAVSSLFTPGHGVFGHRPGPSLRPPAATPRFLHLARLAFLGAGFFFLVFAGMAGRGWIGAGRAPAVFLIAALVLVLTGEIAGRFLFYGLIARPGR